MKFTQIPSTTFATLQLNAGIVVTSFDPATAVADGYLGATSGGVSFQDSVDYVDFGDDIDNCPKNTMELKKIDGRTVTLSGTFVTISPALAKTLVGAADVATNKITPRVDLLEADFADDVWWIGDYSDVNNDTTGTGGAKAGFIAIHLMNVLNTGGFQLQSSDKAKGNFAFELTAHSSIDEQDVVPYEVYVTAGTPAST